ncbi:N-acetylmuramoyl-L-alanine amidase family protein [Paenibacillus taichungensis]|uniref:N-acetylmuramoyl-L-alanine amidase family protein n=1 Tax=Paenibacillus taichungensis TaxID=484184 RepID=UPI00287227E7|nr:N-acetylmuramoyl-L-alanine amidase family protein [Paenibacillus taichungensis]MDR9748280.1 N-acetylmuramoyl-L-alanine amidase family protein [Paenibacillus taichungensis]
MKKTILLLFLSLFFLVVLPHQGNAAASTSKIFLDGEELILPSDVQVTIVNNNVMIPIRVVAENLKFKVDWNQNTRNVKIQQNDKTISLTVDQKQAMVADKQVTLNTAPLILNNTTVVPIRFVSEQMGLNVKWNNKEKIVYLVNTATSKEPNVEPGNGNPTSLTHVTDIQFANNQLVVSMDGESKPVMTTLKNPDRLVVDLPGAVFGDLSQPLNQNMNGKLDVDAYPNVTEVRYSLFKQDPGQVRIVVELNHVKDVQYSQNIIADKLIIDLNVSGDNVTPVPVTPIGDSGRKVVVIDPGHGGKDPGTTSITNKPEKEYNLALALKVQALLLNEPDIELVMTRDGDTYPTRPERVRLANQLNADVFVSIHGNNVESSPQATGTETFYYQRSSSKELATIIHQRLVKAMGLKDRGVKNGNLEVIRDTTMPAVLLEVGFLSNVMDEELMSSDVVQMKAAQAIADGIKEYLGIN